MLTESRTLHSDNSIGVTVPRWLQIIFDRPHECLSWAIVGGGFQIAEQVVWYYVLDKELKPPIQPEQLLREKMDEAGIRNAVVMMTSRRLDKHVKQVLRMGDLWVKVVTTVGLSNALAIGDPPGPAGRIHTINSLVQLSHPLTTEAALEALSMATEARTAAVIQSGWKSQRSGRPATGTGTDCIVVASPTRERPIKYCGKHTKMGSLIGSTVREATQKGLNQWISEFV